MTTLPRESKYRHIFSEVSSVDQSYLDINADCFGESQHIAVNASYWAVPIVAGGGGSFMVHDINQTGRISRDHPLLKYHTARILELSFSNFDDNIIATSSDDCTVRVVKFPEEITEDIVKESVCLSGHTKKPICLAWHPTADNVLASSGNDKIVIVWDVESGSEAIKCPDHEDLVFSIAWNENGKYLGSTCQDRIIRIFDPRDEDATVLKTEGHQLKKISKIFWVNNRNLIGSVGFSKDSSRELLFFDIRNIEKPYHIEKLDKQNSKFFPYFEESNNILFLSGKGDCGIRAYELSDQEGFCHLITEVKMIDPHKGIAVFPRLSLDTKKPEIFKAMRLKSNSIERLSICVPRSSSRTTFQGDLYPDCYAGKPAITIDEYFDGIDKSPIKTKMNPETSGVEESRFKRKVKPHTAVKAEPETKTPVEDKSKLRKNVQSRVTKESDKKEEPKKPAKKEAEQIIERKNKMTEKAADSSNVSYEGDSKLKDELQTLIKNVTKLTKELKEKNDDALKAQKTIEELKKKVQEGEKKIAELEGKLKKAMDGTKDEGNDEEIARLKRSYKKLKRKYKNKSSELKETEELINKQADTIKEQNRKLADYN